MVVLQIFKMQLFNFGGPNLLLGRSSFSATLLLGAYCSTASAVTQKDSLDESTRPIRSASSSLAWDLLGLSKHDDVDVPDWKRRSSCEARGLQLHAARASASDETSEISLSTTSCASSQEDVYVPDWKRRRPCEARRSQLHVDGPTVAPRNHSPKGSQKEKKQTGGNAQKQK